MSFFDRDYIDYLVRLSSAGKLTKRARPAFRLATQEGWLPLREQINGFVDSLSLGSRTRLRRRRFDLENIGQTVNEIKVGMHLSSLGWKIEYEKSFDGLSPDWYVEESNGDGPLFVEVFTKRESDTEALAGEYIEDLRQGLRSLAIGAVISLRLYLAYDKIVWSDTLVNRILSEIKTWLSNRPPAKSILKIDRIEIELWDYSDHLKHVEFVATSNAFWVDPYPVRRMVEEKHRKYSDLCVKHKTSLIAACAASFSTAIDRHHFEEMAPTLFSSLPNLHSIWGFLFDEVLKIENPRKS
jgi:hypothetical protein